MDNERVAELRMGKGGRVRGAAEQVTRQQHCTQYQLTLMIAIGVCPSADQTSGPPLSCPPVHAMLQSPAATLAACNAVSTTVKEGCIRFVSGGRLRASLALLIIFSELDDASTPPQARGKRNAPVSFPTETHCDLQRQVDEAGGERAGAQHTDAQH